MAWWSYCYTHTHTHTHIYIYILIYLKHCTLFNLQLYTRHAAPSLEDSVRAFHPGQGAASWLRRASMDARAGGATGSLSTRHAHHSTHRARCHTRRAIHGTTRHAACRAARCAARRTARGAVCHAARARCACRSGGQSKRRGKQLWLRPHRRDRCAVDSAGPTASKCLLHTPHLRNETRMACALQCP